MSREDEMKWCFDTSIYLNGAKKKKKEPPPPNLGLPPPGFL